MKTELSDDLQKAALRIEGNLCTFAVSDIRMEIQLKLMDGDNAVYEKTMEAGQAGFEVETIIPCPKLWTHETPTLYHLLLKINTDEQVLCIPVGFRKIEIKDQQLF